MSFTALAWGIRQSTSSSTSKLVLLMLCNYADEHGVSYPSQEHLAGLCQITRRSVNKHIQELVKANLIEKYRAVNKSYGYNKYKLNMEYEKNIPKGYEKNILKVREDISHNTINNTNNIYTSKFESWWAVVPRKIGKKKAKSIYERLIKSKEVTEEELITAMERYAESVKHTDDKFIAHASSWLNAGRWSDEIDVKDTKEKFKENWLM